MKMAAPPGSQTALVAADNEKARLIRAQKSGLN
jgi:hypothetical protein